MEVPTTPKLVKCLGGTLSSSPKFKPSFLAHSKKFTILKFVYFNFSSRIEDFGSSVQEKEVHPLASYRSNALDKICL
jgi:hypothetical protein